MNSDCAKRSNLAPVSHPESDWRRRLAGAVLGACLGAAFGFGMAGGWNWLLLVGVPVRHSLSPLIDAGVAGLVCAALGLGVAWPRRAIVGVPIGCLSTMLVALGAGSIVTVWSWLQSRYHPSDVESAIFEFGGLLAMAIIAGVIGGGLAVLGRLLLVVDRWASWRPWSVQLLVGTALVVFVLGLGLTLTLPYDLMIEGANGGREALRAVNQYARAEGLEDYTLELVHAESLKARVRIYPAVGPALECDVGYGNVHRCEPIATPTPD
jgi:hypothetical protein